LIGSICCAAHPDENPISVYPDDDSNGDWKILIIDSAYTESDGSLLNIIFSFREKSFGSTEK
jgi:hypothetical protein